jgi:hypothetical protein
MDTVGQTLCIITGDYDYINYDTVLGVPIDTEGTSLEFFGQSQLNNNLSINYSTKFLNINDKNYSQHRLSSKRRLGTISSLGIYWAKDGLELGWEYWLSKFDIR